MRVDAYIGTNDVTTSEFCEFLNSALVVRGRSSQSMEAFTNNRAAICCVRPAACRLTAGLGGTGKAFAVLDMEGATSGGLASGGRARGQLAKLGNAGPHPDDTGLGFNNGSERQPDRWPARGYRP